MMPKLTALCSRAWQSDGEPDEETREIVEQADADGNEPEPHPAAADENAPQEGPQDLCGVNG